LNNDHHAPVKKKIRVLVADSSRMHTCLLADALKRDPRLEVIPFESDSSALIAAVRGHNVDVLVISASLDEQPSRGLEVLRELRGLHLDTRAVLLLDSTKEEAVLKAFRAGAHGLFGKSEPTELLTKCIRCVSQGQIWANSQALGLALEALASSPAVQSMNASSVKLLSERELQVVRSLAEGLTNREIAARLKLSPHTVKNYLFRIFDKLGVSSRVEVLFMTLSQSGASHPSLEAPLDESQGAHGHAQVEFELLMKAAESGLPAAQLALAHMFLTRRADPRNLVEGYMWYLVATERAWQARAFIAKMMTREQIDEAKQKATLWLAKRKATSLSAVDPSLRPKPPAGDRAYLWTGVPGMFGTNRS
jgi:two-component system, NarL family, nitrate/nitrite response regulator NarL